MSVYIDGFGGSGLRHGPGIVRKYMHVYLSTAGKQADPLDDTESNYLGKKQNSEEPNTAFLRWFMPDGVMASEWLLQLFVF